LSLFGNLFNKFKQGRQRTQELVLAPMGRLLGLRRLDENQLEELEELLLQADLGVRGVARLMERLRFELKKSAEIDPKAALKDELMKILCQVPPRPFTAAGTQVLPSCEQNAPIKSPARNKRNQCCSFSSEVIRPPPTGRQSTRGTPPERSVMEASALSGSKPSRMVSPATPSASTPLPRNPTCKKSFTASRHCCRRWFTSIRLRFCF